MATFLDQQLAWACERILAAEKALAGRGDYDERLDAAWEHLKEIRPDLFEVCGCRKALMELRYLFHVRNPTYHPCSQEVFQNSYLEPVARLRKGLELYGCLEPMPTVNG
jgi:hypothetical protein